MQDIETHTIIYLRELLSTRAVDDPEIAGFFATWFYEETAHGRALARFLAAAGQPVAPRPRTARGLGERIEALGIACIAAAWREFPAVHMTWGAINELTTLTAYRRLAQRRRPSGAQPSCWRRSCATSRATSTSTSIRPSAGSPRRPRRGA